MRKVFALILCVISLFAVACKDGDNSYIEDIDIEESFYQEKVFVGDEIDFSEFSFVVSYNTGEKIDVDYSKVSILNFSTIQEGVCEFTIKYKNKSFKKTCTIYNPVVVSCTYKGGAVVYYKGDEASLSGINFVALYENGKEVNVPLSEASIVSEVSLNESVSNITFEFAGKNFVVPCSVTYKPIERDVEYKFIDLTGGYAGEDFKIVISEDKGYLYVNDRELSNEFTVNEGNYNRYTTLRVIGGVPTVVEMYLVKDTIYMDLPE